MMVRRETIPITNAFHMECNSLNDLIDWFKSKDGWDKALEQSSSEQSINWMHKELIKNILHSEAIRGTDMKAFIQMVILGYACECGTDSKEYHDLKYIFESLFS